MKILIVDDNKQMRKTIRSIITEQIDIVEEGENGEQAFSIFKTFSPDWVIMDYEMNIKDGISALKEIIQYDSKAKVLIVSQYNDLDIMESALNAGAISFINKKNLIEVKKIIMNKNFI